MQTNDSWPKANSLQEVKSGHTVVHWCSDIVCQRIWASRIYQHLYSGGLSATSFSQRPWSKKQYQWSNQWDCRSHFFKVEHTFSHPQKIHQRTHWYMVPLIDLLLWCLNALHQFYWPMVVLMLTMLRWKLNIFYPLHFLLVLEAQGWKSPLNFAFRCTCNFCWNNLWKGLPA